MADPTGDYSLFEPGTQQDLVIFSVDAKGNLSAKLGTANLHGSYDAATQAIAFTTQAPSPQTILRSFYTGTVFFNIKGSPTAMAGIHYVAWGLGLAGPPITQHYWSACYTGGVPG